MNRPRTVVFDAGRNTVVLIDQRRLPHRLTYFRAKNFHETAEAIANMIVRGAGAIGATAAYGLAQGALAFRGSRLGEFRWHVDRVHKTLRDARPTAVDPINAMNGVRAAMAESSTVSGRQQLAMEAAERFADEDVAHCEAIGQVGLPLIRRGLRVLTHCNAGALAFVDVGSATAPLYAAHTIGRKFRVFCSETRPRGQGAALTAWELARAGIEHEIIADGAAGHLMQRGEIGLVITGSDRVLGRTGEVANKIGTYTHAVLAKRHGIAFYVAIPLSTLDWETKSGAAIPIEERAAEEVLTAAGPRGPVRTANPASGARNPAFDVTPPELITGIITPVGIFKPRELWKHRNRLGWVS